MRPVLIVLFIVFSAVAYSDSDDPAKLIPGEYEEVQGKFYVRIQESLAIESDLYIRVISEAEEIHSPLHFTTGLRWNEFEKRFEAEAYHTLPSGCRVDSPTFFSLFKVKGEQLDVTVRLPVRIDFETCRTDGTTLQRWRFNKTNSQEVLVGAIHFLGGFAKRDLSVADTRLARKFRVQIPAFCKDTEILEASVRSQGKSVPVTLIDVQKKLYGIQPGIRIEAIQLTLNAPLEKGCDIPVYATFELGH